MGGDAEEAASRRRPSAGHRLRPHWVASAASAYFDSRLEALEGLAKNITSIPGSFLELPAKAPLNSLLRSSGHGIPQSRAEAEPRPPRPTRPTRHPRRAGQNGNAGFDPQSCYACEQRESHREHHPQQWLHGMLPLTPINSFHVSYGGRDADVYSRSQPNTPPTPRPAPSASGSMPARAPKRTRPTAPPTSSNTWLSKAHRNARNPSSSSRSRTWAAI